MRPRRLADAAIRAPGIAQEQPGQQREVFADEAGEGDERGFEIEAEMRLARGHGHGHCRPHGMAVKQDRCVRGAVTDEPVGRQPVLDEARLAR